MAILPLLAVAGGAIVVGISMRNRQKPRYLVEVLIDKRSVHTTLLPPQIPKSIQVTKALAQDLFGDTRQQYQQSLNAAYDVAAEQQAQHLQKRTLRAATIGLGLATAGLLVSPLFYLPSLGYIVYAFRHSYRAAWHAVWHEQQVDFNVIQAVIVTGPLLAGYIWAAAFAAFFSCINRMLVAKTEWASKANIADLFGRQIRTVWQLVNGVEIETPIQQVQTGDIVVVYAGQPVPVDGIVCHGTATVDQHMLTGESQPAEKGPGDTVLAMTLLVAGIIHVRVENAGNTTVASQIGHMLSQTTDFKQALRSRTERMLTKMILPLLALSAAALPVAGISGALAILWYYPGQRMMTFGPLSMLSYLQVAAQKNILIKDGRSLEVLQEIDMVVFDKTGTLTLEQPSVSRLFCYDGLSEIDLLRYAAAIEAKQSHPLARAIVQAATAQQLVLPKADALEYKAGYGLKTQINGQTVRIGSIRFMTMEDLAIPSAIVAQQAESHASGNSLVLLAIEQAVKGAIELAPTVRPEAAEMVNYLHKRGIQTAIISGDHEAPTRRLATSLGIDRYFAQVLPEDKAKFVAALQDEGHRVCFVGDGINDSIALKTADVAVSLRGATTIATDVAQIVFMDGTLRRLPELFQLVDEFAANMRINWVVSLTPNIAGIAATFLFGWGITQCVFLVPLSTPIVVYNAIRPLLGKPEQNVHPPLAINLENSTFIENSVLMARERSTEIS